MPGPMRLPAPKLPPDSDQWATLLLAERLKRACQSWAIDGYGTPALVFIAYLLKVGVYVGAWLGFCACSARLGAPSSFARWWFEPEALQKAVLWSMAFEALGLGCGSGPLTGRYLPPIGGVLYFARPGTTKLALFPALPLLGGSQRSWFDVALYLAFLALLFRALVAPSVELSLLWPLAVVFPLLSICDRTLFLASRGEHYFTALVCFLFPLELLPALKLVWIGVWMWAATSKLNRHFPAVVCVMISNSAVLRTAWLRKRMYRNYPDDLRPSGLAHVMAHAGTFTEYVFPIVLATSTGGLPTLLGLLVMVGFHTFITSNIPMGVPIEWNVIMVYGAFVLFGHHAEVRAFDVHSLPLALYLLGALLLVPLLGNFVPRLISFLPSMRYYAGNWAYSAWLFHGDSMQKLDRLVKSAPRVDVQLERLYGAERTAALICKVQAFRAMHLHGRALRELIPKAVDDVDAYAWIDGELVAGMVLGWNFGDGHLHDERLLDAIRERCGFAPGELRCILVESQPMFRPHLDYRIVDAATGLFERGRISVEALLEGQPWPEHAPNTR